MMCQEGIESVAELAVRIWVFVTSHEISHTTETDYSPLTRVWLHEGEASGGWRLRGVVPYR